MRQHTAEERRSLESTRPFCVHFTIDTEICQLVEKRKISEVLYLIYRTLLPHPAKKTMAIMAKTWADIHHSGRIKRYPDGRAQIMVSSAHIFVEDGYERHSRDRPPTLLEAAIADIDSGAYEGEQMELEDCAEEMKRIQLSTERSKRRARAKMRDYALCGDWKYFVTLTLSPDKVDRHSVKAATRKLNKWLTNAVQRKGLSYVLVPELHPTSGAIHYHGFFSDMPAIDSGTMKPPTKGKPRRVAKARQAEKLQAGWKIVYNLPDWTLGFSTALELTGDRMQAINYVSKYITKGESKIGGRWYYSGGILRQPQIEYLDLDMNEMAELDGAYRFAIEGVGEFVIIWTEAA